MTYEQKQVAWGEMKDTKEDIRQQILLCACCTNATVEELLPQEEKEGGWKGHGDGDRGDRMKEMVEEECDASTCDGVDEGSLDCDIQWPGRLNFSGMTYEQKQVAWGEMKDTKEDIRQQILLCACCTNATVEELLPQKEEGGWKGKAGGGFGGRGKMKIKHMLDDHCPKFGCPGVDSESVECTWRASSATKKERRKNALNCLCCQNDTISELEDNSEEEVQVSVLLASLLDEPGIEIKESHLNNPASHVTLSLALAFAAGGVAFAMV